MAVHGTRRLQVVAVALKSDENRPLTALDWSELVSTIDTSKWVLILKDPSMHAIDTDFIAADYVANLVEPRTPRTVFDDRKPA